MTASTNHLLDHLVKNLRNDAALARKLQVAPPVISKLRHGKLTVGASLIVKIHEVFGMEISDIKAMAGLPPAHVRGA